MSIEGQGHFFTIYFPGFVCFVLYLAKISGERLQDQWSSGHQISSLSIRLRMESHFLFSSTACRAKSYYCHLGCMCSHSRACVHGICGRDQILVCAQLWIRSSSRTDSLGVIEVHL